MIARRLCSVGIVTFFVISDLWALPGTKGTPLGGFGTGYIIFDARTGQIAAVTKARPASYLKESEFSNHQSSSCGLHFFVQGAATSSKLKATTTDENSLIPIYTASFPAVGGVTFSDTSFGPFISGQSWDKLVHSPLAFFDVTATNTNNANVTVAVALEFANKSSAGLNLLGGTNTGVSDGQNAIAWGGDATNGYAYMIAGSDKASATFSSGAIGTFTTNGTLASGAGNIVAVKCAIPVGGSAHFRFVMSWWNRWELTPASADKPGPEDHWYHNYYSNAKECAVYGMTNFENIRSGAISIVKRTMASNFPDWYKDRLLTNLYPMIHNSVVAKDGRTGFWEGLYAIIGTIDQIEHSALWYVFNWPQNQWRELQFWARSSHKVSEGALLGQVHHDFNGTTNLGWSSYDNTDPNRFLYPWDNSTHDDYSYQKNTTNWMDLNCMFIFKAYELMLATGDKDSLGAYWTYVKNTANRIITICTPNHLPTTSHSTYDSPNAQNDTYASAVSLAAWYAVIEMAKWMNDTATITKYTNWYNAARADFTTTHASLPSFGNAEDANHPEGDVAGYSWARYFGFPANIDSQYIVRGCNNLWNRYSVLSGGSRLGLWHFYQYDHMGGALTAIGQPDKALDIHSWDYESFHQARPAFAHWQNLWGANNNYNSYGTAPNVWRSLFQFTGTLLDNANNRLWIRPIIPTSMQKTIKNAPLINPRGWGTLNYTDSTVTVGTSTRTQYMTVTFDSVTTIKEIVLKNNTSVASPGIVIRNNNSLVTGAIAGLEGSGFEKNIRIVLATPIQVGPGGLYIKVFNGAVPPGETSLGSFTAFQPMKTLSLSSGQIGMDSRTDFTVPISGVVTFDLFQLNGSKIGTIAQLSVTAGSHSFVWNAATVQGTRVNAKVAILKMTSAAGSIARLVHIK